MTLDVRPILAMSTPMPDAWAHARDENEPVFVPIKAHADDRGWSYMNLLVGVLDEGQVNVSTQHPGVVKAWHRHASQTDFWIVLSGHLKVGVWREDDNTAWATVTGDRRPGVVIIPPPLWHGAATVGPDPATLLYYVSEVYDPENPDEDRRAPGSVAGFPWHVEHR